MSFYPNHKSILDEILQSYNRALLRGDRSILDALDKKYELAIVKASKNPESAESIRINIMDAPGQDARSAQQILKDIQKEYEHQNAAYFDPRRKPYICDLKNAREVIKKLSIEYRAYTPFTNLKTIATFAFWHAAVATTFPAILLTSSPDPYIAFAVVGGMIGAFRGILNNNEYHRRELETAKYLKKHFKPATG